MMTIKNIVTTVLIFFSFSSYSQLLENEYNTHTPVAPTTIHNLLNQYPNGITVYDSEAGYPNQVTKDHYAYVSLYIDNNLPPYEWYEVNVKLQITPLKPNGDLDTTFQKDFKVSYNPNSQASGAATLFSDANYLKIKNAYGVKVQVVPNSLTIQNLNGGTISFPDNNVFIKTGFKAVRYYEISEQIINPVTSVNTSNNELTLSWTNFPGAVEYQLEWTWVDGYLESSIIGIKPETDIIFSERDFELNNTRILTSNNSYTIPLIYSKGYLIYRVRPVGRDRSNPDMKKFGLWSSGTNQKVNLSQWPHKYIINIDHENGKNWQFQASFAENGKKKEVVSYFDGSLRNRQTVTKVNTDNKAIVGEVIYDAQGRAAIEVLPVPTLDDNIHFFTAFNRNNSGLTYGIKDFEMKSENSACEPIVGEMSNLSGASKYYSANNDFRGVLNNDYIPDAQNYPFSQTEYTPDNTGRIVRKGGVGVNYQMGSSHEMKYFYTTPTDKELNRLFGYSVGQVERYKKNIVVDPNGQVSVSYLDPQGRTIATALAGGKPDSGALDGLEDEDSNKTINIGTPAKPEDILIHDNVEVDLYKDFNNIVSSGAFSLNKDKSLLSKQIAVAGQSVPYTFNYTMNNLTKYFSASNCPKKYPFVYDLKFTLTDQCGNKEFDVTKQIGSFSLDEALTNLTDQESFEKNLNTGSYSLYKDLTINADALNKYADDYIYRLSHQTTQGPNCYVNPQTFLPTATIDFCGLDCNNCLTRIGDTIQNYVGTELKNFYNNQSFVVTPNTAADNVTVTFTNSNTDNNGTANIDQIEVDALVIKYVAEWKLLLAQCDILCEKPVFNNNCEGNRGALLADMSPYGQYGSVDEQIAEKYKLSVFNHNPNPITNNPTGALFTYDKNTNTGKVVDNDWKNPSSAYKKSTGETFIEIAKHTENNVVSYLPDIDDGVTPTSYIPAKFDINGNEIVKILPNQLKDVNEFLARWDDNWAESLLKYHPEYAYLKYQEEVCKKTNDYVVKKGQNNFTVTLSSNGYDDLLMKTNTVQEALDNKMNGVSLFDFTEAGIKAIYLNDPYFNKDFYSTADPNVVDPNNAHRKALLQYAVDTAYLSSTDSNNQTVNIRLIDVAAKAVLGNPLTQTPDTFSLATLNGLNPTVKGEIWKSYKSLYVSFKSKVMHVFSNIYAMENGAYNGCIGDNLSPNVTNVLADFFPQKSILYNYIQGLQSLNSLCNSTSAILYKDKIKRYMPIDVTYDSGSNANDVLNDMASANGYQYYQQTGACPLLFDLELLLDGFFSDVDLNITYNPLQLPANTQFKKHFLSQKYLSSMLSYSQQITLNNDNFPLSTINIETSTAGSTLNIDFNGKLKGGVTNFNTKKNSISGLKINVPAGKFWGNYNFAGFNTSEWKIVDVKQLIYDKLASAPSQGKFVFKGIAVISHGGSTDTEDVVFTGETFAQIGACGTINDGVGEVLDPNAGNNGANPSGCDKKYKFNRALTGLLNQLRATNKLNSTTEVDLNSYASYTNSYLREFFNDIAYVGTTLQPATVKWVKAGDTYKFVKQSAILATFEVKTTSVGANAGTVSSVRDIVYNATNTTQMTFENTTISTLDNYSDVFKWSFTEQISNSYPNGSVLQIVGKVNGINNRTKLDFSCCPVLTQPCAPNDPDCDGVIVNDNCPNNYNPSQLDSDGDGIGDACSDGRETACVNSIFKERTFEDRLKDFLNFALSPQNPRTNVVNGGVTFTSIDNLFTNNSNVNTFMQDCNILQRFRNNRYSGSPIVPFVVDKVTITMNQPSNQGPYTLISFDDTTTNTIGYTGFYLNISMVNIKTITKVDLVKQVNYDANDFIFEYLDNNNISHTSRFYAYVKDLKANAPALIQPISFCKFFTFDNCLDCRESNSKVAIEENNNHCITCIPIQPEPIGCNKQTIEDYKTFLQLQQQTITYTDDDNNPANDTYTFYKSNRINGYTIELDELDDFCKNNYQYLLASYIYYMNSLDISSSSDVRFVTIAQFGDTFLNYGYKHINSVIDAYKNYYSGELHLNDGDPTNDVSINDGDFFNWNYWVNNIYILPSGPDYCPPAPFTNNTTPSLPTNITPACQGLVKNLQDVNGADAYNAFLQAKRKEFIEGYIKEAMKASETAKMIYYDKEYQYTLYYYDQAGNLIQTVAPEGVKRLNPSEIDAKNTAINNFRSGINGTSSLTSEDATLQPQHTFKTQYSYNSLNQLVWQSTPDGGETRFAYDKLGRIIASQNAKQKLANKYSYTLYDVLGRITEAGETTANNYSISNEGRLFEAGNTTALDFVGLSLPKTQVTRTVYDIDPQLETNKYASSLFSTNTVATVGEQLLNNRNRVTGVFYHEQYDSNNPLTFNNAILYNYDIHGNVKELLTYYSALKNANCNPATIIGQDQHGKDIKNDCEVHLKRIVYDYDLISGNVNKVIFQPGKTDQYIHKYAYDADNRIVNVETSKEGVIWETDARYFYYPHGPLSRVEVGDKKVQGIDYAYTLQGWLKVVNGENLSSSVNDLGNDGAFYQNTRIADAFGYSLNYNNKDYKAISETAITDAFKPLMYSRNASNASTRELYNGNIKQMTTAIRKSGNDLLDVQKNNYSYDQLNRIVAMNSVAINPATNNAITSISSSYSYDRNGNLKTLLRNAFDVNNNLLTMDNLSYDYKTNNQLALVHDTAGNSAAFNNDLENQKTQLQAAGIAYDINNANTHNYVYDEIGQLIEDRTEKLRIEWRVDGKVQRVFNNKNQTVITFEYDGLGNRIGKRVQKQNEVERTHYSRDAQGNVLAVYDEKYNVYENLQNTLILNSYNVSNTQFKRAINDIIVSNDGNASVLSSTANVTFHAGNTITFKPGFEAKSGSELSAVIQPVVATPSASSYVLKEHHIYGGSRLGIEENATPIYNYNNTSETYKTSLSSGLGKQVNTFASLTGSPIDKNYALTVSPFNYTKWTTGLLSNEIITNPSLNKFNISTKFKLSSSYSNNEYNIGVLQYSGITTGDSETIVPLYNEVESSSNVIFDDEFCVSVSSDNIGGVNILTQASGFVPSAKTAQEEKIIDQSNQAQNVTGDGSGCPGTYTGGKSEIFGVNQDGLVEFTTASFKTNSKIGLNIGVEFYGFKIALVEGVNKLQLLLGPNTVTTATGVGLTDKLRIVRRGTTIDLLKNGVSLLASPLSVNGINLYQSDLFIDLFGKNSIKNLRASELQTVSKTITNSLQVTLVKVDANGFKPKFTLTQFETDQNNVTTAKRASITTSTKYVSDSDIINTGADFVTNFGVTSNQLSGQITINGVTENLTTATLNNVTATLPTTLSNQLGGTLNGFAGVAFDMCYFNYNLGYNTLQVSRNFSFDDYNNTNYSLSHNSVQMSQYSSSNNQTIPFVRNFGSCLVDTDQDGIFDVYETQDLSSLAFIDTDNDGLANHNDPDDDGDGIFTINEGSNRDGDKNPSDALNTDSDQKPDYLDVDDDNDGYATWETYEGGSGHVNAIIPTEVSGAAYVLDSDADNVKNYLDPTNGGFQVELPITHDYFASLIGNKRYELSNHLGNVLSVVSDKKIPDFVIQQERDGSIRKYFKKFNPDVISYSDYYPFGMLVPNRHKSYDDYRYGFQGQEKDDELKGEGNSLNYTFRMHDPRVGRFFATDPLEAKYPYLTPYQFSSNQPIHASELEGCESSNEIKPYSYDNSGNQIDKETGKSYVNEMEEVTVKAVIENPFKKALRAVSNFSNDIIGDFTGAKHLNYEIYNKGLAKYQNLNKPSEVDAVIYSPFLLVGGVIGGAEIGLFSADAATYEELFALGRKEMAKKMAYGMSTNFVSQWIANGGNLKRINGVEFVASAFGTYSSTIIGEAFSLSYANYEEHEKDPTKSILRTPENVDQAILQIGGGIFSTYMGNKIDGKFNYNTIYSSEFIYREMAKFIIETGSNIAPNLDERINKN